MAVHDTARAVRRAVHMRARQVSDSARLRAQCALFGSLFMDIVHEHCPWTMLKKNDPRDLGRHSMVLELRYMNYLELDVWYKHHNLVLGLR